MHCSVVLGNGVTVARLALDQLAKVRILLPQPRAPIQVGALFYMVAKLVAVNGKVPVVGYPLLVAFLSLLFALQVATDYTKRQRLHQSVWATALVMSAIASMGYLAASQSGTAWAFRLYYVFGALLVAPYMGMGSLFLVLPFSVARTLLWCVHILGAIGTLLIFTADIDVEALAALSGDSGRGVLQPGPWLPFVIVLNLFGTIAVSGTALYSAVKAIVTRQDWRFCLGNGVIGIGFLVVAMAGSAARWWPDWDGAFWTAMAVGWCVAFGGFRIVTAAIEVRSGRKVETSAKGVEG